MKVQFYNSTLGWIDDDTVVNDSSARTLAPGKILKLDSAFNGKWNTSLACCSAGTYRVWAAVTNENKNIARNYNQSSIVATYNFTIQ